MNTRSISQKPLMLNFIQPQKAVTIDAKDYELFYDPIKQIAYYMGGGSGSRNTTSQRGWRNTREQVAQGTYHDYNDAPVTTDD